MRTLNRYILRQVWTPALMAAVVISFLVVAGAVQEQLELLREQLPIVQVSLGDISWMSIYALPTLVGYIFPVTLLVGIMLTFGRMAQQDEITAMKAAGIPLKRVVAPIVMTGAVLSGVCFLALDQGQTWAYRELKRLVRHDLPLRMTLDVLPTGVMHQYGEWQVYIGRKAPDGSLHNIVVLLPREDGEATAFYADSAALVSEGGNSKLVMRQGYYIEPSKPGEPVSRGRFETLTRTVPRLASMEKESRQALTLSELIRSQAGLAQLYAETEALAYAAELRKQRIEIAERLAFPLMCLAVSMVAAPVGARTRRAGRAYTFVAGLVIIGAYFLLRKLVEPPFIPTLPVAVALAQIPNLALCSAGAALIWRVDRV